MAKKTTKEEIQTINLMYQIVQPTRSFCYDHIDEAELVCEYCGSQMEVGRQFCSAKCKSASWHENVHERC